MLRLGDRDRSIILPLVGDFQVANALAAAGLAIATGRMPKTYCGRFQTLARPRPIAAGRQHRRARFDLCRLCAYAGRAGRRVRGATPACERKTDNVFGCGGDRDPGKRPEMGRIAGALADRVIVTDDNPRSEHPADIRRQILRVAKARKKSATVPRPSLGLFALSEPETFSWSRVRSMKPARPLAPKCCLSTTPKLCWPPSGTSSDDQRAGSMDERRGCFDNGRLRRGSLADLRRVYGLADHRPR